MTDDVAELGLRSPAEYAALIEEHFETPDSDGIVVLPVTPHRLASAIAASGRAGDEVLGAFAGRDPVRVSEIAEVAMLAGCEPRAMPLLIATLEIMLDDDFPAALLLDSKKGYFPYLVINGPLRQQLGVNCRPNVFGPGFRANATIGRALHLALMRFGGASPANATIGNAFKYTCVIGEDEENSPWPPFSVERGFNPDESTVTLMVGIHTKVLSHQLSARPEHLLSTYAEEVSTVSQFDPLDISSSKAAHSPKAVFVLAADHRGYMKDAGWDRRKMQEYLHSVTHRPAKDARLAGYHGDPRLAGRTGSDPVWIYDGPDDYLIIAAGSGGGRSMIGAVAHAVTRQVPAVAVSLPSHAAPTGAPSTLEDYVAMVEKMVDQKMTDGWPVVLPDAEGVSRFVAASGRAADTQLGSAAWRSGPITVQDLAINAVMAGCRPGYMPVLCTIYELLFEQDSPGLGMAASTMGYNAWYIVHGPAAKEIGLNHGGGLLGPGARANVSIGRAIRLGMMNLAGLKPDLVDRACLGQAFKYGAVIAEDEDASPWAPLHTTFGFAAEESAVTMSWGAHPRITFNSEATRPEELLRAIAEDLAVITNLDSPSARGPAGGTLGTSLNDPGAIMRNMGRLVVMGEGHRKILEAAGWSREQAQAFLFERCKRRVSDARAKGFETSPFIQPDDKAEDRVALVPKPEALHLLFAGGAGGTTIAVSSVTATRSMSPESDTPVFRNANLA